MSISDSINDRPTHTRIYISVSAHLSAFN